MYCVQCGSEQAEGAKFCHSCGSPLTPTAGPESPAPVRRQPRVVGPWLALVAVAAGVAVLAGVGAWALLGNGDGSGGPSAGDRTPEATVATDTGQDGGSNDASLQVGDTVTILNPTGDSIALRVTPSMISVTLGRASNGSSATITGGPATAEGYTWYEIQTSEGTGWTRSEYLQRGGQPAVDESPPDSSVPGGTSDTVVFDISMAENFFEPNELMVPVGQEFRLNLINDGEFVHSMRIAGPDGQYDTEDDLASKQTAIKAGETGELVGQIDEPGTYIFQCDFHPEETGTITVR